MTATTFALNNIQRDGMNIKICKDLGLLLSRMLELVANNKKKEISNVAEKFWNLVKSTLRLS